jgi:hypothetical protein
MEQLIEIEKQIQKQRKVAVFSRESQLTSKLNAVALFAE